MTETVVVNREFVFDAAHRITNHPGKCSSLHGHSWRVRVGVQGQVDPETGMVIDFYDLKQIGTALFDKQWDHAVLLAEWDLLVPVCVAIKSRMQVFPFEPTSENLAHCIADFFRRHLPSQVQLAYVEIWETANCSATVRVRG